MKISAVLFDFGKVLSGPPDPGARKRMESILGVGSDDFDDAYWRFRDAYDRGQLNAVPYWQAVAAHLRRPMTPAQQAQLIAADNAHWTTPNRPMIRWAGRVKASGFKIGLLSNIGDAMELGVLESCPWLNGFDHLTFSHRLGMAKPDAAIYVHAAAGLGVAPSEIIFIDDREENVTGAMANGMLALQYTSHIEFVDAIEALRQRTGLPSASDNECAS